MKTLVVMNEKGGVGKTNIASHAGWFLSEKYRTLVVDLDQQANLTFTLGAHLAAENSVDLFAEGGRIVPVGPLTVARATRDLLAVEQGDASGLPIFSENLAAMAGDYDVCVIDTPPALANRTFAALLAADAVLAPVGINDYSLAGIANLLEAIKGVSAHFEREEPQFLGLIPSIFDRRSKRERELFESLAEQVGQLLFPGIIAKRDAYANAAGSLSPVWEIKTPAGREASEEIRGVFTRVASMMELGQ